MRLTANTKQKDAFIEKLVQKSMLFITAFGLSIVSSDILLEATLGNFLIIFSMIYLLIDSVYHDIEKMKVPLGKTLSVMVIVITYSTVVNGYKPLLVGMLFFGILMFLRKIGMSAIGMSDILFVTTAVAYFFPINTLYPTIFLAVSLSSSLIYGTRAEAKTKIPFYPFLLVGFMATLFLIKNGGYNGLYASIIATTFFLYLSQKFTNFEYKKYLIILTVVLSTSSFI